MCRTILILSSLIILIPEFASEVKPVSLYLTYGNAKLQDNGLDERLGRFGYSIAGDKRSIWGFGLYGKLHKRLMWNLYIDNFGVGVGTPEYSLSVSDFMITAGAGYKMIEIGGFRMLPVIGLGYGASKIKAYEDFPRFNPLEMDIEDLMDDPARTSEFGKSFLLLNVQLVMDFALHLKTSNDGKEYLLLFGLRSGYYKTLMDSQATLGALKILNFPYDNLDNSYLSFFVGVQIK